MHEEAFAVELPPGVVDELIDLDRVAREIAGGRSTLESGNTSRRKARALGHIQKWLDTIACERGKRRVIPDPMGPIRRSGADAAKVFVVKAEEGVVGGWVVVVVGGD